MQSSYKLCNCSFFYSLLFLFFWDTLKSIPNTYLSINKNGRFHNTFFLRYPDYYSKRSVGITAMEQWMQKLPNRLGVQHHGSQLPEKLALTATERPGTLVNTLTAMCSFNKHKEPLWEAAWSLRIHSQCCISKPIFRSRSTIPLISV